MPRVFRHYVAYRLLALLAMDAAVVFASVFVGLQAELLGLQPILPGPGPVLPKAAVLTLAVLTTLHFAQFYDLRRVYGRRELTLRLGLALGAAYLLMAALAFPGTALRLDGGAFVVSLVVSFVALFVAHEAYRAITSSSRRRRRLLLLGSGRPAQIIAGTVNGSNPNYEVLGCVDGLGDSSGLHGVRILGTVEELPRVSRTVRPDVIVVALTERRQSLPVPAILDCKFQGIEVEDWPSFYEKLTGKILITDLRPSWIIFAEGFSRNSVTLAVKRWMDVVLSAVGLLLTLPAWPLIALLIKLESAGPVFYRQERLGKGTQVFTLIKFRSMRQDAEQASGPVWAGEHDPRVTRLGRVLRKTRLDELPQLLNVLVGTMSLVGPRPERPAFISLLQEQIPFYVHRLAVKPGVTGWAQVKYRYGSTVDDALEKLQYDLYYIKNLSIFLDLLILFQTVQVVLFARGSR